MSSSSDLGPLKTKGWSQLLGACFPPTAQMGPRLSHLLLKLLVLLPVVPIADVFMVDILIVTCLWSFTSFFL